MVGGAPRPGPAPPFLGIGHGPGPSGEGLELALEEFPPASQDSLLRPPLSCQTWSSGPQAGSSQQALGLVRFLLGLDMGVSVPWPWAS